MMRSVVVLSLLAGAWSQSIKNCGGPSDLLSNVTITLTPDPFTKGQNITIDVTGHLNENITDLTTNVNLSVKTLRIIDVSVTGALPLSQSPAIAAGPQHIKVGPMKLPSLPGSFEMTGKVHIMSGSKPVGCVELNLNVPAGSELPAEELHAPEASEEAAWQGFNPWGKKDVQSVTSCGKASDHMPDAQIVTSGGVTTVTGTLDEAVTQGIVDVDLKVKAFIISIPVKMTIPFLVTPGFAKGAAKTIIGPSTITVKPATSSTVTGTVKVNDAKAEEIVCLNLGTALAGAGLDHADLLVV